jgi:8-oxo-dGTP pyrophosphatase MutT (NUDIX family)
MQYNKSLTATVYVVNRGRVLLHMHKKYKTWFAVGGHFEPNELPHECAIREVKEETGLDVSLVKISSHPYDVGLVDKVPQPFCIYHEGDITEQFLDFIYIATAESDKLNPEADESDTPKWFTREELEANDVKIHIKNTALAVLDYMENKR